jgi:aminomethyltransferase
VASSYELHHDREYHAIRSSAALFDVSPLFKYHVRGADALRLMDRVVTRDVANAKVGQVLYTPWCDGFGKVIDDGTVSILSPDFQRRTSAEPNNRWLCENTRGLKVAIEDASDSFGALALQGPNARIILQHASGTDLSSLRFFRLTSALIRGVPVTITRTGYTGDLGYEIWMEAEHALPVWDAIMAAGAPYGITPAGMLALDVARIEAGLLLLDVDATCRRGKRSSSNRIVAARTRLEWTVDSTSPRSLDMKRWSRNASVPRNGDSSASKSRGNRSRHSTPSSDSPRDCPPPRGERAFRCTRLTRIARSATRPAAAGPRCSSGT